MKTLLAVAVCAGVVFASPVYAAMYPVGPDPEKLTIGDWNQDGCADVVVANNQSDTDTDDFAMDASLSILLGNCDGTLQAEMRKNPPNPVRHISALAFGQHGIVFTDDDGADEGAKDRLRILKWGGQWYAKDLDYAGLRDFALSDLNGDGWEDAAVVSYEFPLIVAMGTESGFGAESVYHVGYDPYAVALADIDQDGLLDAVAAQRYHRRTAMLPGVGAGAFGSRQVTLLDAMPLDIVAGDFAEGGNLEAITSADFALPIKNMDVGDLNDDGHLDIAAAYGKWVYATAPAHWEGGVALYYGDGVGDFSAPEMHAYGQQVYDVKIADLDGAGLPDLVFSLTTDDKIAVEVR